MTQLRKLSAESGPTGPSNRRQSRRATIIRDLDAGGLFTDDDYFTGPPLTEDLVRGAERQLGYKLPPDYLAVLRVRNGGTLRNQAVFTPFATSWAPDHIGIDGLLGIGGDWGIDSPSLGSQEMIREWGYPDIGIVFCSTPSAGHDAVMLDYSMCGPDGEPAVAYIDEDRVPRQIASSFIDFIDRLAPDPPGED